MSEMLSPARASALRVAGMGALSMMTGSSPARTAVWTRTIGVRPRRFALSVVVIKKAGEPSAIRERSRR